jgi:hypothetical protein
MKQVLLTLLIVFSTTALFAQAKADTAKNPMKWVLQKNDADSNRAILMDPENSRSKKLFYTAPPNSPPMPKRPNTDLIDVR